MEIPFSCAHSSMLGGKFKCSNDVTKHRQSFICICIQSRAKKVYKGMDKL